jgi:hypothetical protein
MIESVWEWEIGLVAMTQIEKQNWVASIYIMLTNSVVKYII